MKPSLVEADLSQILHCCHAPTSAFHGGKRDSNYTHYEKVDQHSNEMISANPFEKVSRRTTAQLITTGIRTMKETDVEVIFAISFKIEL